MDQPPQIPPAVIQFAEENNCVEPIYNETWAKPIRTFKDYTVYNTKKKEDNIPYYYLYILVNKNEIRFAEPNEIEILNTIIYL